MYSLQRSLAQRFFGTLPTVSHIHEEILVVRLTPILPCVDDIFQFRGYAVASGSTVKVSRSAEPSHARENFISQFVYLSIFRFLFENNNYRKFDPVVVDSFVNPTSSSAFPFPTTRYLAPNVLSGSSSLNRLLPIFVHVKPGTRRGFPDRTVHSCEIRLTVFLFSKS